MNTHSRRVAGQRLPRLDGIGKVTGKHVYAADFTLPGMLFGKVLRSRRAHALIRKLDTSRAAAIANSTTGMAAHSPKTHAMRLPMRLVKAVQPIPLASCTYFPQCIPTSAQPLCDASDIGVAR